MIAILPETRIAVIGAGPAGLAAAAWLKRQGFAPVLIEAAAEIGGQWNPGAANSGVWPGMRTNTSRVLSAFSDLDHAPGTAVYPTAEEMHAYLARYASLQGIDGAVWLRSRVERLARDGDDWQVTLRGPDGVRAERFARVVVATGRHTAPAMPDVPGLAGFTGDAGAVHSFAYRGAAAYRGRRVLVAGCSISALEIACELAMGGARQVVLAARRQRYVMQKLVAGVPADHLAFTRFAARAGAVLPPGALAEGMKRFVLGSAGSPDQVGAPAPAEDIFAAGITQSQSFLPLVAEGRIAVRPWLDDVQGTRVRFTDGAVEEVDGIVLGTGYRLSLPFLEEAATRALEIDGDHATLFDHTFHPDLPHLAFLGMYEQVGPLLPVLELQARWLAYAWGGKVAMPDAAQMRAGLEASRAARRGPREVPMHVLAAIFARHAGVEPDPAHWPGLCRALMFGPLAPASYRLEGPDALADAPVRLAEAAALFGCQPTQALAPEEQERWDMLLGAEASQAA